MESKKKIEHIIIDIPEMSLDYNESNWVENIKVEFENIQRRINEVSGSSSSTFSNSAWLMFFLKYGDFLLSTKGQEAMKGTSIAKFFEKALNLNSVGGGHTTGYNFFQNCLLSKGEVDICGIKIRRRYEQHVNECVGSRQIIWYGAPGTGKSYKIKGLVTKGNHVRTTFHPDSDYASFVGAYKPTMIEIPSRDMAGHVILDNGDEVKEKKIVYEFVAQAFLQAYTEAWKRSVGKMTDKACNTVDMPEGMDDKYYLVIEEINRGNCAQIFGDLFQLLDRDDNGESSYAIRPDQDMKRFLAEQFKDIEILPEAIRRGEEMKLPSNLYIFATMNTSDQSLFPIDSAFKRRWDWEYVPIKDEKKGYYIKVGDNAYLWSDFLEKINETILRVTQSDDKQMGYWFVHLPEGQKEISTDKFVGKVLFYLWNDVFKDFGDGEDTIFIGEKSDGSKYELRFKSFFGDERNERISDLMRYNKVEPTEIEDAAEEQIAEKLENTDGPINIDKSSSAYNKWKNKHDTYWAACQEAYVNDPILKLGQRTDYPNAYDIPLEDGNGVTMRVWHLTHKGEKCIAIGVWIPETTSADAVEALVGAIPEWNEKLNQKFVHLSLNTGSHIRAYSPQYDFNNPADVEASIEWVKKLAPIFYNTVEDTLKGIE